MRPSVVLLLTILLVGVTPVSAFSEPINQNSLGLASNRNVMVNASGSLVKVNVNGEEVIFINSLPVTIEESGYYVLNVSANVSGTAIEIDADNVVLDGAGHTIRGDGWDMGVYIWKHNNITIKNLKIQNFWDGVYLEDSSNINVINNNIINNDYGVHLYYSSNVNLSNNTIENNYWSGALLEASSNVRLVNNVFLGGGLFVLDSHNNTIVNNTVNGKPLVYVENADGFNLTTPNYAGQVIIVNSENILISNQNLNNTSIGIQLYRVINTTIINNNITNNNWKGVCLFYSSNINLSNNTIMNNNWYGIYLEDSSNVNLINNTITNNGGVYLYYSDDIILKSNNITNNDGLTFYLYSANNITIFLNSFVNNFQQVEIYNSENVFFHSSEPLKYVYNGKIFTNYLGNYWDKYSGTDSNGDGVGDLPYVISDDFSDDYPLISPASEYKILPKLKGDVNGDGKITATDALLYLRFAVGLDISPYHLDPIVDDLTGDGRITAVDALLVLRAAVGLITLT